MKRTVHLPKGLLEFYILSLLSTYPAKGVELIETIRKKTDGMWSPSPGSIYPLLRRLESEGYIYSVSKDNRYVVTEKGKQKLEKLKAEMVQINSIINSVLKEVRI